MDPQTSVEIVKCYYASQCSAIAALRMFETQRALHKDPFTTTAITKIIRKFEKRGSVLDKLRSGRPSVEEDKVAGVAKAVSECSARSSLASTSVHKIADEVGLSKSSMHKIMTQHLCLFPYKLQLLQSQNPSDMPQRRRFAQWFLANQTLIPKIMWSDEANFSIDGTINTHNCRI
jgi:hypothetical protein